MAKHTWEHIKFALTHVTDWSCALDVGANRGDVTKLLSPRFRKVHAFEPGPTSLIKFRNMIKDEKLTNVKVHPYALSSFDGQCWYGMERLGNKVEKMSYIDANRSGSTVVQRLDTVVPAHLTVGLLKLDIEGGEFDALIGASALLSRCSPILVIEDSQLIYGQMPEGQQTRLYNYLQALSYMKLKHFEHDSVWSRLT